MDNLSASEAGLGGTCWRLAILPPSYAKHRTEATDWFNSLGTLLFLLKPFDLVSKLTGLFVILLIDRLLHLSPQLDQCLLILRRYAGSIRLSPAMPGSTMDVGQQWFQLFSKMSVVVGAPQTSAFSEISERHPAHRAFFAIGFLQFLKFRLPLQLLRNHLSERRWGCGSLATGEEFPGVILAQVQDDRPLRVGQLGDVEGGRLLAMHAFHSASPQTIYRAS